MCETIDAASEFAFLGLRLNQGIEIENYMAVSERILFGNHTKKNWNGYESRPHSNIERTPFLTRRGMLFSNEVFAVFI